MHPALVALAVLRLALKLDLGPEFDSNANRAEVYRGPVVLMPGDTPPPQPIAAFLLRSSATGALTWTRGANSLHLALTGGGKLFFGDAATPQDTAVVAATIDDSLRLRDRALLTLSGDYYDAYQPIDCPPIIVGGTSQPDATCHRDFRAGGPRASATILVGDFDLSASAGFRGFDWKPDPDLSFTGPAGQVSVAWHGKTGPPEDERDWDLALSGRLDYRAFSGPALVSSSDPGSPLSPRRADLDAQGFAELSFVGPLLASAGYLLDWNRSNSFGQTFTRHVVILKVAFDLPWSIVATFRGQLVFETYKDALVVATSMVVPLTIEDESRNAVLIDLERPLGRGFAVDARYSTFRNGVGAVLDYERHVVFLGLSYRSGTSR